MTVEAVASWVRIIDKSKCVPADNVLNVHRGALLFTAVCDLSRGSLSMELTWRSRLR